MVEIPVETLADRRLKQAQQYDRILANNAAAGNRRRLIRKQVSDQRDWENAWAISERLVSRGQIDLLIDRAVEEVKAVRDRWGQVAYGWSGGKDSLALQVIMDRAGITDTVFTITNLEYPAFLTWATDAMPDGCEVINVGLDLEWLSRTPDMLFPPDAKASGKWFRFVQHTGQQQFIVRHGIECMFLGRRRMDGNLIGRDGMTESRRGRFFNPIRAWTHEQVLATLRHHEIELPPFYGWPRGWQCGTHPWAARQFCRSVQHGFSEIWQIDQSLVYDAADWLPEAREFLASH